MKHIDIGESTELEIGRDWSGRWQIWTHVHVGRISFEWSTRRLRPHGFTLWTADGTYIGPCRLPWRRV